LQFEIKDRPSYALLELRLDKDETIRAEAGAMTYMSPAIQVETRMREGGFWSTLGLSVLGAQSFFVNDYTARGGEGVLGLVSAPVGDIARIPLSEDKGYVIQKASYVASSPAIDLDIKWEGFSKGLFGQGLFMIRARGKGDLFINTFGAIETRDLADGEELIVDNFHLVGFSDNCKYDVRKFGGLKSTLLGGEGLVTSIRGPGTIYIQTKNPKEFADWLWTLLEPRVQARAR
jgi:uncharacterized protein (TIGR00266 family)